MAARKSDIPRPKAKSRRTGRSSPPPLNLDEELLEFLPPPPLGLGEDELLYHRMLGRVRTAVDPKDMVEEIWCRDLVDITLDCFRLRRLKAGWFRLMSMKHLDGFLEPIVEDKEQRADLVDGVAREDPSAEAKAKAIIRATGSELDLIGTFALVDEIEFVERIDRLIMQSEARRNIVLREIDRRRDVAARRVRETLGDIEDAMVEEVADPRPSK